MYHYTLWECPLSATAFSLEVFSQQIITTSFLVFFFIPLVFFQFWCANVHACACGVCVGGWVCVCTFACVGHMCRSTGMYVWQHVRLMLGLILPYYILLNKALTLGVRLRLCEAIWQGSLSKPRTHKYSDMASIANQASSLWRSASLGS